MGNPLVEYDKARAILTTYHQVNDGCQPMQTFNLKLQEKNKLLEEELTALREKYRALQNELSNREVRLATLNHELEDKSAFMAKLQEDFENAIYHLSYRTKLKK